MICLNCNEGFVSKTPRQKYCSLICANKAIMRAKHENNRKEYNTNPICCHICSAPIPYEKRHERSRNPERVYCGHSCAAVANNHLYPKKESKQPIQCLCCNVSFIPMYQAKTFCSNKCSLDYRKLRTREHILSGQVSRNKQLKAFLIKEHGEKCSECAQGPRWNRKPLVLQVDHIDGNTDNNFPNNLRLLCPNCHTQTETYGRKNRKADSQRSRHRNAYRAKKRQNGASEEGQTPISGVALQGSIVELRMHEHSK